MIIRSPAPLGVQITLRVVTSVLVKFFFCSLFHISSVTYWLTSKSRDTQRENNIQDTKFEVLAAVGVNHYDLT